MMENINVSTPNDGLGDPLRNAFVKVNLNFTELDNGKEVKLLASDSTKYYRGDKSWQTLDKTAVGLNLVDNTADSNKPVSIPQQNALATKAPLAHTHTVSQITDFPTFKTIENQSIIGAGNIDLDKASVGLGNVDNTSDLSKPLSTATINALATKAPISSVHNPVTLGTANGLSLSNQQLSLGLASSSTTGALSGTDWNTFNNKQNALTNPITGTGVAGQISFWSGTGTQIGDSGLTFDGTNGLVLTKQIILDAQNIAFIIGNNTPTNFAQFYYNSVNKALQFTKSNGDNTIVVKDVTGNVGINQVLPTEKLDVVGNGKFSGTISASPATTANQVVVKSQLDAVASSGTYTPSNQTNDTQTVNFTRSYWKKNGNVLTVTTSLTYTVTQIQSTSSFFITLPNGFLVSGANNGNIIGSSLLHNTQGIFNNNANMKAYETSDSSKINLQANFQAPTSSGTYETTIIYTVLIQ